ncbi:hypothetical protein DESC_460167 [Desulfosarcina cetonica]|nr:hypothetical protein DESC_460167 [Desulfosarcina cetonica]
MGVLTPRIDCRTLLKVFMIPLFITLAVSEQPGLPRTILKNDLFQLQTKFQKCPRPGCPLNCLVIH